MAYPASTGLLSVKLIQIHQIMAGVRLRCQQVRNESAAGPIPSSRILDLFVYLGDQRLMLDDARNTPGIGAYAQNQFNNAGIDIVAEFNATVTAIDNTRAWIDANFPKDAGGFLLAKQITSGSVVDRQFTTAQLNAFRTQLDSLIATIS